VLRRSIATLDTVTDEDVPAMTRPDAPIKVLFVEDDERLAQLAARYFEGSGFLVSVVAAGPGAIAEAGQRKFDFVLLDLMLLGATGSTCVGSCELAATFR
jgi:DNA-binding response OmpR family regulator